MDKELHQISAFLFRQREYVCFGSFLASLVLLSLSLLAPPLFPQLNLVLVPTIGTALVVAILLAIQSILIFRDQCRGTDAEFRNTECEYFSIFQNVLDAILILDDNGCCLDANPAAINILKCRRRDLVGNSIDRFFSGEGSEQPSWRSFVRPAIQPAQRCVIAGDGNKLFVHFSSAPDYLPGRHVVILCDVTERTKAEMKIIEQLRAVEAARAETEALRKATLALSQNLAMDSVLDTLLDCISGLVPFDRATVLFVEDGVELLVARESPHSVPKRMGFTLKASNSAFFQHLLVEKQALFLMDTSMHDEWRDVAPLERLQSWMGIPLIAGGSVLGILSLGALAPSTFTKEHFRLAKSLSIPAAVAIQNARIHERAEIYAAELEIRLRSSRFEPNLPD